MSILLDSLKQSWLAGAMMMQRGMSATIAGWKDRQLSLFVAHAGAVISVFLTLRWALGLDVKSGYLGGLVWDDKDLIFNWHPVLMVVGTVVAMTEAVLAYRTLGTRGDGGRRTAVKVVHMLWQTSALLFMGVGLRAVFANHAETEKGDYWSMHSWLGILLIGAFLIHYLSGLFAFFFQLASESLRASLLPGHIAMGMCIYILAIITVETGVAEKVSLMNVCTSRPGNAIAPHKGLAVNGLLLPGCRLGNYLAMAMLVTGIATIHVLLSPRPSARAAEEAALRSPAGHKGARYGSLTGLSLA